jgi:PKD repeat protein
MKMMRMKATNQSSPDRMLRSRAAVAGLLASVVLSLMLETASRADIYRSATNTPGGISSQFTITASVAGTNTTVSWYGPHAWYTVQAATSALGPWTDVGITAATNHAWSFTFNNQGIAYSVYRVKQNNSFSGAGACAGCHGDKYSDYAGTLHSQAYNLFSASGSYPITSLTVGAGQPNGFSNIISTPQLANVGCENCHGPASWHKYSDHDLILPAVSIDPKICGGCHTGPTIPQYDEYATSAHAKVTQAPATSTGCRTCHSATVRETMLDEYEDSQAGHSHALTLPTGTDATFVTVACATCHDPHVYDTNTTAQLRYPTRSTNFYSMPTFVDTRTVLTTNIMGVVSTNSVTLNTTFDSLYDPNIQVCGQCHNTRGARWDGRAYGLITNSVIGTNIVYVDVYTNIITTNVIGGVTYYLTNSYVIGQTNMAVQVTNQVLGVGVLPTNQVTYTSGGKLNYATNSDGSPAINSSGYSREPHYSVQYNTLIGILDYDYFNTNALGVATNRMHAHGSSTPKQCTTCHVPSYTSNGTNVTGHTFALNYYNCQQTCHSALTSDALTAKIEDRQSITTNAITRIVSLLNQWATNVAPAILRTNYGTLAWEFTTFGALSVSNSLAAAGPPSAFAWKTNATLPSGTNDNLQLVIPEDIRRARFNIYMVSHDGSLGVHNPSYVPLLLSDAENRVIGQFQSNNYAAVFSANTNLTFVGTNVVFTNLSSSATGGSWDFGDTTSATGLNPTHAYAAPGIYSVTFTESGGQSLTRTAYIQVRQYPLVTFSANLRSGPVPLTVTFTNTSTGTNDVGWWRWQFNTADSSTRLETPDPSPVSFTYTNAGSFSVLLRANLDGNSNVSSTSNNYVSVFGAVFSGTPASGVAPLTVTFTNQSLGTSNYIWNFGDGNTSTGTNVVNTYTNPGTYTVALTASYAGYTNTLTRTNYIIVRPPPIANFTAGPALTNPAPLTVYFTNLSANATSYNWAFGDGKSSTSTNAVNTYTNAGSYTVTLKAIAQGVTNTLSRTNYIVAQ